MSNDFEGFSIYADETSCLDWESYSPLLNATTRNNVLSGPVSFPIRNDKLEAVQIFLKHEVFKQPDVLLKEYFPHFLTTQDLSHFVETVEDLKIFYTNGLFSLKDLAEIPVHEFCPYAESRELSLEKRVDLLRSVSLLSFLHGIGLDDQLTASFPNSTEIDPLRALTIKLESLIELSAQFAALTGQEKTPFAALSRRQNRFEPVKQLFSVIGTINASRVLGPDIARWTASSALERIFHGLDTRELDILRNRFFSDEQETLGSIGDRMGLSRERIRQIEREAKKTIALRFASAKSLLELSKFVVNQIEPVRPLEDFLAANPILTESVPSIGEPVWRVLDRLDDSFEISGYWCYAPSESQVTYEIDKLIEDSRDSFGTIKLTKLNFLRINDPDDYNIYLQQWIEEQGFAIFDGHLLTATRSAIDLAGAILSIEEKSLSIDEILQRLPLQRSRASLSDRLRQDSRFVKADKDAWALARWKLPEYAPIRTLIQKAVDSNQGTIEFTKLVDSLTSQFSISEASVLAYASNPPFELHEGLVQASRGGTESRKQPQDTARFYRHSNAWVYRLRVNDQALKGFSIPLPIAISNVLGLTRGEKKELASPLGQQSVSWKGLSPHIGTIRRFLEQLNSANDDLVFLQFDDRGTFNVVPATLDQSSSLSLALSLIGLDATMNGATALEALSLAVCLSASASRSTTIYAYKAKGDQKIFELLLDCQDELPEFQELNQKASEEDEFFDITQLL